MLNKIKSLRSDRRLRRISNLGLVTSILSFLYEGLLIFATWYPMQRLINYVIERKEVTFLDPWFIAWVIACIVVVAGYFVVEYFKYTASLEVHAYFQNRTVEEQAIQSLSTNADQMAQYKVATNVGNSVVNIIQSAAPIALGLVFLVFVFAVYSYKLSGITIVSIAASGCFLFIALPFLQRMVSERVQDDSRIESAKAQRLEEFSIMYSLGLEGVGAKVVTKATDKLLKEEIARHAKWNLVLSAFNFIPTIGKAALVLFILGMMYQGVVNQDPSIIGVCYMLLAWSIRMEQKSQDIQNLAQTLIGGKVSWGLLESFWSSDIENPQPQLWPSEMLGAISLSGVSVTFTDESGQLVKALDEISLDIEPGSCSVIYGANGDGKSTLLKLLQKVPQYSHYTGSVKIDGVELSDIDSKKYRQEYLAVVSQDLDLIRGTVYSNVAISKSNTSEHDVVAALQVVGYNLSGGDQIPLYKDVSQFGEKLSGGQKQKISLARAFHRDEARILLIDEPTSALDDASAERIIAKFSDLAKQGKYTIIIVTHDLRFKRNGDFRVINLKDGKIQLSMTV